MSINLSALMKQRYDTAANWTAQNPTLLAGEIGIESDTKKWKVGTGSTAWTSLVYAIGGTYPIVNADIAAGAAIAYSKLASLTSGNIVLGSAANVATSTAVTGDVTISNTGVTAIAAGVIVNADINASAAIVDTKLATIATAGKVSNSATTAASANTASAIVARDASGNFTAGTITAALTGAASANVLKAGDTMTGVLAVTAGTAALPGIAVSGDTNTGIYSPGADQVAIATGGTGRLFVNAAGLVDISNTTADKLTLSYPGFGIGTFGVDSTGSLLFKADEANTQASSIIQFKIDGGEKVRIDSSGRLLVGTSTAPTGTLSQYSKFSIYLNNQATSAGGQLNLVGGARGLLSTGDKLGQLIFTDSTDGEYGKITCELDATPGAGDYPGRLVFSTTADGAASPTERMRIDSQGRLMVVATSFTDAANGFLVGSGGLIYATTTSTPCASFNRLTDDGGLLVFKQANTEEGSISVSGTTVSYNGAHLSRWSQLPSGVERTEILRGSVLSNIDEMCAWTDEENEQLNRMKVSDVEGDKNVSGVFQAWDDDDDTYTDDFYCAMTGDFIIRIAEGVTVERGDLLMSAGDGTAKPQDDEIIRSKTIAKVTSTNVSCTYEDGSYCVPCVLMAC